jgi:hypothetical protein
MSAYKMMPDPSKSCDRSGSKERIKQKWLNEVYLELKSAKVKSPHNVVKRLEKCFKDQKSRLDEKRQNQDKSDMAKLQSKPNINKNSKKLASATKQRMTYLQHAKSYNKIKESKYMKSEQLKFEEEMKECTGKPKINHKSKHIKRTVDDLYAWQQKQENKTNQAKDRLENEANQQLSSIMSAKIINPYSEKLASKCRNMNEPIENKLLREGEKNKLKNHKKQEQFYKESIMLEPSTKTDYKKILYHKKALKEDDKLDLEQISKIGARQQVINKLFKSYKNEQYQAWNMSQPWKVE